MEHQRQRAGGGRRRRRKQRQNQPRTVAEPILIAARRPNAPLVARAAESARSPALAPRAEPKPENGKAPPAKPEPAPRRSARIVQVVKSDADERERERRRLLDRIMASETRGAITRTTDDYLRGGFELPAEQPVQLQLLEHFDEERARSAVEALTLLIAKEAPYKRPILEQRLRRLEEYGEDPSIRAAAADLRRAIRS